MDNWLERVWEEKGWKVSKTIGDKISDEHTLVVKI